MKKKQNPDSYRDKTKRQLQSFSRTKSQRGDPPKKLQFAPFRQISRTITNV
jgi:hypothetical protein